MGDTREAPEWLGVAGVAAARGGSKQAVSMFSHQQQQFLHDEQQQQQHMMFMAKRLEALVQQAEEQFRRGRGGAAFMLCLEAAALEAHLDPLAALLHATLPQQAWPHLNNNANHNNANHSNHLASSASSPHYLVSAPGTAAADERLSAMAPLLGAEAVNFELSQLAIADLISASQSLTLPGDPDLDAATEFDWKLEVACDTTPAATATSATTAPSSSSSASSSSNGLSYPSNCTSASLSASASALLHSAHSSHSSHSSLFESGLIPPPPPASASAIRTIDARDYAYVARGMLLLGLLLRGGFGVELNKPRAFEWFRHSASRGNYLAMHQMACCLQNGWGVEKDRARAQALIRMCISDVISLAGRTDDWLAVYMYGYSLHDGFGCVANVVVAREAYRRSAMQGLGFSSYNLGLMYDLGEGGHVNKALARKLYAQAAERGHLLASVNLGVLHEKGEGGPQDYEEARRRYQLAADRGHPLAQYNIGVVYDLGQGVPQNTELAIRYYELAAAQNHASAMFNLGYLYDTGESTLLNHAEARKYYHMAADHDHAAACYNLGLLYDSGVGGDRDLKKARELFLKAAALGNPRAMFAVGWTFEQGHGVNVDMVECVRWYIKALRNGFADARGRIAKLLADNKVPWRTEFYRLFPASVKHTVETLLTLALVDRSSMRVLFPEAPLWMLPPEILHEVFSHLLDCVPEDSIKIDIESTEQPDPDDKASS